jgi:uncharacterized membrane-anchored protein
MDIFSNLASQSLDSVIYGLIMTFLAGFVIGFLVYEMTKTDRYIYTYANLTPPLKKGPPRIHKKQDTKKYPTKITRSS